MLAIPTPHRLTPILGLFGLLGLAVLAQPVKAASRQVTVSVENLAPANSVAFAPLRLAFHSGIYDPFNAGQSANLAVQRIAELGSNDPWEADFLSADTSATAGSVPPVPLTPGAGSSALFSVDVVQNPYFSFATMVVPSNDAFIGNDDPMAYRLFDNAGNLLIGSITVRAGQVWDAGSELQDPLTAAFLQIGNAGGHADQSGLVSLNFSNFAGYDGLTTAAGYVFDNQLAADTDIYRISFNVSPVPEPETYALLLAGLGLVGLAARRRRRVARID